MFTIAICDDHEVQLKLIGEAVDRYFAASSHLTYEVSAFSDPSAFLESLEASGGWDIVILDVCMPGMLGTSLARGIRQRHDRTEIIFLPVPREYAVDAFSVNAVHYLMKPFSQDDFNEAMNRAVSAFLAIKPRKLLLQIGNGTVKAVDIEDILYIESVAYRRVVHTADAIYEEARMTLAKLEEKLEELSPGQFIQPYRGYIVNLSAIKTISTDRIVMQNGDSIIIKRGDFRRLREQFFQWSFKAKDSV